MDRVLETVNFEAKFSSLPEFRPAAAAGGGGVAAVPSSPQAGLGSKQHGRLPRLRSFQYRFQHLISLLTTFL
jgi:hypothetical protein